MSREDWARCIQSLMADFGFVLCQEERGIFLLKIVTILTLIEEDTRTQRAVRDFYIVSEN